jgi:hypothetical protein
MYACMRVCGVYVYARMRACMCVRAFVRVCVWAVGW